MYYTVESDQSDSDKHTYTCQSSSGARWEISATVNVLKNAAAPLYLQDYVGQVPRLRSCVVNAPGDTGKNRTMGG